jgi:hypothetical protein
VNVQCSQYESNTSALNRPPVPVLRPFRIGRVRFFVRGTGAVSGGKIPGHRTGPHRRPMRSPRPAGLKTPAPKSLGSVTPFLLRFAVGQKLGKSVTSPPKNIVRPVSCLAFRSGRLSLLCHACDEWPAAPHVIGDVAYCPTCCPSCTTQGELLRGPSDGTPKNFRPAGFQRQSAKRATSFSDGSGSSTP